MFTAQDAYWTDFYDLGDASADTIYDEAWYEARAAEKEVPYDSATSTGNELWSAKETAEAALVAA